MEYSVFEEWSEAEFLRYRRRALGLTQTELAARSGVPQSHISAAERRTRRLSEAEALRIGEIIMARPSQLWEAMKDRVVLVLDSHGLTEVRVFGSVARGEDTQDSDLDLIAAGDVSLLDKIRIEAELETLLSLPVDLTIDTGRDTPVWRDIRREAVTA